MHLDSASTSKLGAVGDVRNMSIVRVILRSFREIHRTSDGDDQDRVRTCRARSEPGGGTPVSGPASAGSR
jgi:hypothetical protein